MTYPVETKEVVLSYPVTIAGKEYKTLTIRRPKVRDQIIADKQHKEAADKEVHLMSLLAAVDPAVIQDLDLDDYTEVQEVIVGFRKKRSGNENSNED